MDNPSTMDPNELEEMRQKAFNDKQERELNSIRESIRNSVRQGNEEVCSTNIMEYFPKYFKILKKENPNLRTYEMPFNIRGKFTCIWWGTREKQNRLNALEDIVYRTGSYCTKDPVDIKEIMEFKDILSPDLKIVTNLMNRLIDSPIKHLCVTRRV